MQSSGGLTDAAGAGAHAALTVLSGPAGGVGGALLLAELAGERDVLCFDMGGTSCDVCLIVERRGRGDRGAHVAGPPAGAADARHPHGRRRRRLDRLARRRRRAARRARAPRAPTRARPATGAAASSRPSPTPTSCSGACSRTRRSPAACGSTATAAERAVARARRRARASTRSAAPRGSCASPRPRCCGALRVMTVERGIDPRGFALMPFGGAGPLHAAALAARARHRGASSARAPPACCPRSASPPRRRGATWRARSCCQAEPERALAGARAERLRARARRRSSARACAALAAPPRAAAVRYELRYRGQSFELASRSRDSRRPARRCARRSRAPTSALRLSRRRRRGRAGHDPRLGLGPAPRARACASAGIGAARAGARDQGPTVASAPRRPCSSASRLGRRGPHVRGTIHAAPRRSAST